MRNKKKKNNKKKTAQTPKKEVKIDERPLK